MKTKDEKQTFVLITFRVIRTNAYFVIAANRCGNFVRTYIHDIQKPPNNTFF